MQHVKTLAQSHAEVMENAAKHQNVAEEAGAARAVAGGIVMMVVVFMTPYCKINLLLKNTWKKATLIAPTHSPNYKSNQKNSRALQVP